MTAFGLPPKMPLQSFAFLQSTNLLFERFDTFFKFSDKHSAEDSLSGQRRADIALPAFRLCQTLTSLLSEGGQIRLNFTEDRQYEVFRLAHRRHRSIVPVRRIFFWRRRMP